MKTGCSDLLRFGLKLFLDTVVLSVGLLFLSVIGGCVAASSSDAPKQADTASGVKDTDNGSGDNDTVTGLEPPDTNSVDTEDTGDESESDKDSDSSDGNTIYIDCQAGSDDNSGQSEALALKTLAKASSIEIQPGDRILLKSGTVCEGTSPHFVPEHRWSPSPRLSSSRGRGRPQPEKKNSRRGLRTLSRFD